MSASDDTDEIVVEEFDEISRRLGSAYSGFVNYGGGVLALELDALYSSQGVPFIRWIILTPKEGLRISDRVHYNRNSIPSK
jgi:hypothetical protein